MVSLFLIVACGKFIGLVGLPSSAAENYVFSIIYRGLGRNLSFNRYITVTLFLFNWYYCCWRHSRCECDAILSWWIMCWMTWLRKYIENIPRLLLLLRLLNVLIVVFCTRNMLSKSCLEHVLQLVPYYIVNVINFPGLTGIFVAVLFSGSLRFVPHLILSQTSYLFISLFFHLRVSTNMRHIRSLNGLASCECLLSYLVAWAGRGLRMWFRQLLL